MRANAGRAYGKKGDVITCIHKFFPMKKSFVFGIQAKTTLRKPMLP